GDFLSVPYTSYVFYINLAVFISQISALIGIIKLYINISPLVQYVKMKQKLINIKGTIFVLFWQYTILTVLMKYNILKMPVSLSTLTSAEFANNINNTLICMEMLIISIMNWYIFNCIQDNVFTEDQNGP